VRLLITRPEPECERTAALLRARGHEVLLLPLLRIEPIADAELGAAPWTAVVFTSANAIRAITDHRRFGEIAALPAYVVGQRTRAAALTAGFAPVMSADGHVNDLVRLIASKPPGASLPLKDASLYNWGAANSSPPPWGEGSRVGVERSGTASPRSHDPPSQPSPARGEGVATAQPHVNQVPVLLYCAGEDRTGDLAGALRALGFRAQTATVYRSIMETNLTPDLCTALAAGQVDGVLHYSTRTAAAFVAAVTKAGINDLSMQIRHFCLSSQVAAPLVAAGAKAIQVADEPSEQALLSGIGWA